MEGVFSILKQWIAAESAQNRLAGVLMPNGERMGKYVVLIVEVGLGSLTTAQCASQFERVYWEWLRQDAAYVGEGGGESDEGEEEGEQEQGEGEGGHDEGADEDFMEENWENGQREFCSKLHVRSASAAGV